MKINYYADGNIESEDYRFDDGILYSSTKEVAIKQFYPSGELKATIYLNKDGMLSREDGPAYTEFFEGSGEVVRFNAYLVDGLFFEKDGRATIQAYNSPTEYNSIYEKYGVQKSRLDTAPIEYKFIDIDMSSTNATNLKSILKKYSKVEISEYTEDQIANMRSEQIEDILKSTINSLSNIKSTLEENKKFQIDNLKRRFGFSDEEIEYIKKIDKELESKKPKFKRLHDKFELELELELKQLKF
jgi:regulator of replication initiation timing